HDRGDTSAGDAPHEHGTPGAGPKAHRERERRKEACVGGAESSRKSAEMPRHEEEESAGEDSAEESEGDAAGENDPEEVETAHVEEPETDQSVDLKTGDGALDIDHELDSMRDALKEIETSLGSIEGIKKELREAQNKL